MILLIRGGGGGGYTGPSIFTFHYDSINSHAANSIKTFHIYIYISL